MTVHASFCWDCKNKMVVGFGCIVFYRLRKIWNHLNHLSLFAQTKYWSKYSYVNLLYFIILIYSWSILWPKVFVRNQSKYMTKPNIIAFGDHDTFLWTWDNFAKKWRLALSICHYCYLQCCKKNSTIWIQSFLINVRHFCQMEEVLLINSRL